MKRHNIARLLAILVLGLALVVNTGCEEDSDSCGESTGADIVAETGAEIGADAAVAEETTPAWEHGLTMVVVYADEQGETHFKDEEIGFQEVDYAPPAPPMFVSATAAAAAYLFIEGGPDYDSGLHPAPARQIVIVIRGGIEVETSDGEIRQFGAGSLLLAEDVTGPGHITRALGNGEGAVLAAIPLP